MSYYQGNLNNMKTKFWESVSPGWNPGQLIDQVIPLLISKKPDSAIVTMAITSILSNSDKLNLSNLNQKCDPGFVRAQSGGSCFKLQDEKFNFWQAADACIKYGADLVKFRNDLEVQGLVQLLQTGLLPSFLFQEAPEHLDLIFITTSNQLLIIKLIETE